MDITLCQKHKNRRLKNGLEYFRSATKHARSTRNMLRVTVLQVTLSVVFIDESSLLSESCMKKQVAFIPSLKAIEQARGEVLK